MRKCLEITGDKDSAGSNDDGDAKMEDDTVTVHRPTAGPVQLEISGHIGQYSTGHFHIWPLKVIIIVEMEVQPTQDSD